MPTGCGTWPAFWANGPNWPAGGEIDILEGVNGFTQNQVSLRSSSSSFLRLLETREADFASFLSFCRSPFTLDPDAPSLPTSELPRPSPPETSTRTTVDPPLPLTRDVVCVRLLPTTTEPTSTPMVEVFTLVRPLLSLSSFPPESNASSFPSPLSNLSLPSSLSFFLPSFSEVGHYRYLGLLLPSRGNPRRHHCRSASPLDLGNSSGQLPFHHL